MRSLVVAGIVLVSLALMLGCTMIVDPATLPQASAGQAMPEAAGWETWVLASVDSVLPAAPPQGDAARDDLAGVRAAMAQADETALQRVAYWNAGAPNFRWVQIAIGEHAQAGINPSPRWARGMALLNTAIYDAMVATWRAKYTHNRPHPSQADPSIQPHLAVAESPSYPSEHAVAAGAAAAVLGYLFPERAEAIDALAAEAAQSRVMAGVHYPSDVEAGLALGRAVAQEVIARGMADGSDAVWDGVMPTEAGMWTGENPVQPTSGTWQTWVLASGDALRPAPPPAWDSEQMQVELDALKAITPTFATRSEAFFWQSPRGTSQYFFNETTRLLFESGLDASPPEAARIYAAVSVGLADSFIACYDAKYAYWSLRPFQVDAELQTLFPSPNFPSYPSAHSCVSTTTATVLSSFFPGEEPALFTNAHAAGMARMYAGIHFQSDIDAGETLGRGVGDLVVQRVQEMTTP